jgi:hypothetical protein
MRPGSIGIKTLLLLAAVLAVALGVRLAFVRTAGLNLPYADEREYHVLALEMQHSWAYANAAGQPVVFWPPGYPYFLAGVYRAMVPSVQAARAAQAVLGALTCILVYLIAARLLRDRRAAVLAAAFAAIYPLAVYSASTLYPAVLQTFLLACVIYLCLVAKGHPGGRRVSGAAIVAALSAGLAGACSAFVAASAVPALLCAAAWLAWPAGQAGPARDGGAAGSGTRSGTERGGPSGSEGPAGGGAPGPSASRGAREGASDAGPVYAGEPALASYVVPPPRRGAPVLGRGLGGRLALAIIFLAPLAVGVGGWSYRNARDFGRPVAISANGGFNFWLGNHPDVTATTGNRMTPGMRRELGAVYAKYRNPAVRDSVLFQTGLRYASSDPGRFVRLSAAKAANFWRLYPQPMTDVQPAAGNARWLSLLSFGLLLPFGAVWLLRSIRRSDGARLIFLVFISYTLVHAAFISKVRFRLPLDTYVLIYAAGAIVALFDVARRRIGADR